MLQTNFRLIDGRIGVVVDDAHIGWMSVEVNGVFFTRNAVYGSDDPVVYGFQTAFCGNAGRIDFDKVGSGGWEFEPKDAW